MSKIIKQNRNLTTINNYRILWNIKDEYDCYAQKLSGNSEKTSYIKTFKTRLAQAKEFNDVYEIVKDTVKLSLGRYRVGLMLILEDLPLQVGAYHPVGSNSIVMNRRFLQIVQATAKSITVVNSFTYTILLHEYLHALGLLREAEVRPLVHQVSKESFGHDHLVTKLAKKGPWSLLKDLPIGSIDAPKRVAEIVKNFERGHQQYIS